MNQPPHKLIARQFPYQRLRQENLAMSKNMHMTPLIFGQLQDPCDAVENGRGHLLAAPLFQVRVPGGAYARENRDLLAPQPRRSAPASDGETDFPRVHLLTPGAQEPRKLSLTTR
jgi:hypothetical protein